MDRRKRTPNDFERFGYPIQSLCCTIGDKGAVIRSLCLGTERGRMILRTSDELERWTKTPQAATETRGLDLWGFLYRPNSQESVSRQHHMFSRLAMATLFRAGTELGGETSLPLSERGGCDGGIGHAACRTA